MSLITEASSQIPRGVQRRGDGYFTRRAVRIVLGTRWLVSAIVRGSQDYRVRLARDEDAINVSCDCPYYDGNLEPCKHIWATLRQADEDGFLEGSGKGGRVRILTDEEIPSEWDVDEEDTLDDESSEDFSPNALWTSSPAISKTVQFLREQHRNVQPPAQPTWRQVLERLALSAEQEDHPKRAAWPIGREIVYLIDLPATAKGEGVVVEIAIRDRKKSGDWSKAKPQNISHEQIALLPEPADRKILSLLAGSKRPLTHSTGYYSTFGSYSSRHLLSNPLRDTLVPEICQTGRCFLRTSPSDELKPLHWSDGEPWVFRLQVQGDKSAKHYVVEGSLQRGTERMPLAAPVLLVAGGLVFFTDRVAPLDDGGAFHWISMLRREGKLVVPAKHGSELLDYILKLPQPPTVDLPPELKYEQIALTPTPHLKITTRRERDWEQNRLLGTLSFDYDGILVPARQACRGIFRAEERRLLVCDPAAERAAIELLGRVGFRELYRWGEHLGLELVPRNLPRALRTLVEAGWQVEAEGKLFRQAGAIRIEVNSGIDWFELHGDVEFGDTTAKLPALLAALKKGENSVQLDDGTFGMLPEEWLKKYGVLAGLGSAQDDHLRFTRSQVGLLDALLASQPDTTCDAVFTQARDELRRFEGIAPIDPTAGFVGQLRGYQRDGLGWLTFLQKFGFGGCLADDMGLGKTVQVLALLESRRALRNCVAGAASSNPPPPGPSLVVVPKSLVFNWKQEATRFAPQLKVLDHTGVERVKGNEHFDEYDIVITTYGTLRRDALLFKDVRFDYLILDESQTIKNSNTESAKAARLLRGDHRLALSGTPVENHLGELWSLFEFLNPGMLGTASVFRLGGAGARNPEPETRSLLARALRPFILRRTKDQVAKDLPQKLEQTLYCELEPAQRKLYDELREHYRSSLLKRIAQDGINKSKIQILEALLRLRQASIHPALIDKTKTAEPSAKLDMLLPQITEVIDEGHKVLVFSQFTSMLAIVRSRLDRAKLVYEYLDGKTQDRAARVERFQTDPDCKLFLISLKAGGLGLNLTAAEYVFLLDPWWNPAVEAQAIDRTHRIGQTRQVFAYRLIARDTVEEKVVQLQNSKRALADAIINADNSLIRDLGREDLELLLS